MASALELETLVLVSVRLILDTPKGRIEFIVVSPFLEAFT